MLENIDNILVEIWTIFPATFCVAILFFLIVSALYKAPSYLFSSIVPLNQQHNGWIHGSRYDWNGGER